MFTRGKIYTAYEKPEAAEPTARVELVREGFSFWAFLFTFFWLLAQRQWIATAGYFGAMVVLALVGETLGLSEFSRGLLQLLLQFLLGYHAYDLVRWNLTRKGYRFAGIVTGDSELQAQQRYYEFAS